MTMMEIQKCPIKVGDFVKTCRGGDEHSRSLIWKAVDVIDNVGTPAIRIRLVSGTFVDYQKEYGPGYERNIRMTSVKKIDVVEEEVS